MIDYRQSGVDIEEGYRAVDKYKAHAARTFVPGMLNGLGSFAGMFEVPAGMKHPVMISDVTTTEYYEKFKEPDSFYQMIFNSNSSQI